MLFPTYVNASEHGCTNEEKVYWKNLAQNVVASYDAVTTDNKVKFTIKNKKLAKKKKLYVQVRAYALDGKTRVYGKWSKAVKVRVK